MIICIVGPSCVGKTTSGNLLSELYGIPCIEASDFVYDRKNETNSKKDILRFVDDEFKTKGKDTFAKDVVGEVYSSYDNNVIICGYRAVEEVEFTRQNFEEVFVLGIFANSMLRFQRKLKRDSPASDYTYLDFIEKDLIEYGFGIIGLLRDETDDMILNEGSLEQLEKELDKSISPKLSG